ncbi:cupin domain-containing protein [Polaromonas sp.]|uniref:cupin domain-containing protein n=1 Tax=Polaromonas sp. TaxID=1869339 RepID=UPI0017AD82DD|nr:cupin domain-containing protein [Polaromonas sp.]NMM06791.1 cupin domain-containing protein [Polaromonas sp.]
MTTKAFVVAPKDYPRPLNVVGEHITVLASGAATGGYEIFLQEGPEGSGPVPHSHPWDESFFVARGEVDFSIDGADQTALTGTLVHLPAGTMHAFRFRQGGAAMVSMTSRLGASSMFAELDREIAPEQPDIEKLVAVARQHGLTIAEPG